MEEVYMIPQKELDQLVQYYKGELTENAPLNKAATLAAKKHALLSQPNLPPSIVNAKTKPISRELTKLTKQLRQFAGGMGAPGGPRGDEEREVEEEGDLVTGPVEQWLKRTIKDTPPPPNRTQPPPVQSSRTVSRPPVAVKFPFPKSKAGKPLTSQGEKDLTQRLEALRERRKTLEKKVSEASPWGKGKGKGKGALALERLKALSGWEDWAQGQKSRRRLEYDSA